MPVRLTIRPPRTTKSRVVEFDDARVTIGRSSRCDIRLPFGVVSGHHLTILQSANSLQVLDEGSTNGTLLDGEPLAAGVERQIAWGAILEIVDLSIEVELVPNLEGGLSLGHTGTLARQMLGEALLGAAPDEELESAYFEVLNGPSKGQTHTVPDDLECGRIADDEDALIALPGASVALEIYRDGDGFGLRLAHDAVVEAPVSVNDTALLEERTLISGDTIVAGAIKLRFVDPLESYLDELDGVIPSTGAPSDHASQSSDAPKRAEPGLATVPVHDEPEETAPVGQNQARNDLPSKPKDPGSAVRSLSAIEVGVVAISLVVLCGVFYLLLSIFGAI